MWCARGSRPVRRKVTTSGRYSFPDMKSPAVEDVQLGARSAGGVRATSGRAAGEAAMKSGTVLRDCERCPETVPGLEHKRLREAFREWVIFSVDCLATYPLTVRRIIR